MGEISARSVALHAAANPLREPFDVVQFLQGRHRENEAVVFFQILFKGFRSGDELLRVLHVFFVLRLENFVGLLLAVGQANVVRLAGDLQRRRLRLGFLGGEQRSWNQQKQSAPHAGMDQVPHFGMIPNIQMNDVNIGLIGLGNVGSGALSILAANADQIALKLGFRLRVTAVCSRSVAGRELPAGLGELMRTANWREVVSNPNVDIVAELIGGTTVAMEIIEGAIAHGKSIVTANKELMALCGAEIWDRAIKANINLAMEASVAGGIPIHAVLREGISGDRIVAIAGILNGTSNYILTEMERRGESFDSILAEAQALGYAEADPSADVDGYDARSKLAILAALAFGERITPSDIYVEGIRRITAQDFDYAHQLGHTIRLVCGATQTERGLILSVRPALIRQSTILASVQGAYNAVWVKGHFGADTFYYGRGAGASPTGVAVVSDLMRVAREIRCGSPERVSPFAHERLGEYEPVSITLQHRPYYLRFRVEDGPGIIAELARILAAKQISLEAVLQLPGDTKHNLPFVITVEPSSELAIREAVEQMSRLSFLREPPLALPMEPPL
jgi:homoserine dehydrogenase